MLKGALELVRFVKNLDGQCGKSAVCLAPLTPGWPMRTLKPASLHVSCRPRAVTGITEDTLSSTAAISYGRRARTAPAPILKSANAAGDSIRMRQERQRKYTERSSGQSADIHLPFRSVVLTIRFRPKHLVTPQVNVNPCQKPKHKHGRSLLISNLPCPAGTSRTPRRWSKSSHFRGLTARRGRAAHAL